MSLIEIVSEILAAATCKYTLSQLTSLVENHTEYKGKSKGKELQKRIRQILQDELKQGDNNSYIELKVGRFKGTIDLS